MDEKKLAEQLRRRSRGALDRAMRAFTPYVGAVVWRELSRSAATKEDVEDAVAEVFLALWAHAGEIDPARGLRPWLGAVARRKAADVLRRLPPTCPLEEHHPSPAPGPADQAERRDRAEALWKAVDGLDEPDRTLFLRYYYGEEKLKDVAAALGMNLSTAKTRLARGRKHLKAILTRGGGAP